MLFMDAIIGENICIYDEEGNFLYSGCKCSDNELLVQENYINPKLVGAVYFIRKNVPIRRR